MDEALNRVLSVPGSMVMFQVVDIGIQCDITTGGRAFRGTGNTSDAAILAAAEEGIRILTAEV